MDHDELLAKIDEPDHWFKPFLDIRQAFRAVVELHKPMGDNEYCAECHPDHYGSYPCPTIQAIEKVLDVER